MTATPPLHPLNERIARLLRHVDGVELPASGTWTVPATHATISFSTERFLHRTESTVGRGVDATIELATNAEDACVSVTFDDIGGVFETPVGSAASPMRLVARALPGSDRWAMAGSVFSDSADFPL